MALTQTATERLYTALPIRNQTVNQRAQQPNVVTAPTVSASTDVVLARAMEA